MSVNNLLKDDRKVVIEFIAAETNLTFGTVATILHDHLDMHKVCARWVPRHLSAVQRLLRHDLSRELLHRYEQNMQDFELRIITCDESWLHHYNPITKRQSMEWVTHGDSRPVKSLSQPSAGKVLLTVF